MKCKWISFFRWALLLLLLSFLGWTLETISCYLQFGIFLDRGFLILPFCPIYGTLVLLVYLLLGSPARGGWLLKKLKLGLFRIAVYFLMGALLASGLELATGLLFEKLYGVILWDYTWHMFDFMKYTSLEMTLLWGVLIMGVMGLLFPWLRCLIDKIPPKAVLVTTPVLLAAVAADTVICFFF